MLIRHEGLMEKGNSLYSLSEVDSDLRSQVVFSIHFACNFTMFISTKNFLEKLSDIELSAVYTDSEL